MLLCMVSLKSSPLHPGIWFQPQSHDLHGLPFFPQRCLCLSWRLCPSNHLNAAPDSGRENYHNWMQSFCSQGDQLTNSQSKHAKTQAILVEVWLPVCWFPWTEFRFPCVFCSGSKRNYRRRQMKGLLWVINRGKRSRLVALWICLVTCGIDNVNTGLSCLCS